MPHPLEHSDPGAPLSVSEADQLAEVMSAFTTGSRLRLLYALAEQERSVDELAEAAGLGATVASQQLRVLRQLGIVAPRREGRRVYYRLADHHIADLLSAIRFSAEHRQLAAPVAPTTGATAEPSAAESPR